MQYNNWYILQDTFYCDIKVDGIWKFVQCRINKFDESTKKISITSNDGNKYEIIIDFKRIDSYFIGTSNKVEKFKDYLRKFK